MKKRRHMDKLVLKKGGVLVLHLTEYDEEQEKHIHTEEVLEKVPTAYQMHDLPLELEEGLLFKDVLEYVNKDLSIWDLLLGNWCEEYVKAGLEPLPNEPEEDDGMEIKFLRVYNHLEVSEHKDSRTIDGLGRYDFDGRGVYTRDDENSGMKVGDWMNIGVGFSATNRLAQYPIKIDREYELWYWNYSTRDSNKMIRKENGELDYDHPEANPRRLYTLTDMSISLFDFLYAIFWELSFHGGPEATAKVKEDLIKSVEEIKNGTAKLIPADEVFKELDERLDEMEEEKEPTVH